MGEAGATRLIAMFGAANDAVRAEKERLCDLDGAIGDADHGTTMELGLRAANAALARLEADVAPSRVFDVAAKAFLDAVGASTGPLYATAFRQAACRLEGCCGFTLEDQVVVLEAIADGIALRGKAARGDKTMLDVWRPAAEAGRSALRAGAAPRDLWHAVLAAGAEGAEDTRSMVAARGRAARLGNRSLGHLDPGAASAVLFLAAMAATLGA